MRKNILAIVLVALMAMSTFSVLLTSAAQMDVERPSKDLEGNHFVEFDMGSPSRSEGPMAFNATEHMGYTTSAPGIDGTMAPNEWSEAAIYNIGTSNKPVNMYIMFDDSKIYIAVDAVTDVTSDANDPPQGYVTDSATDFVLITFDGDNDDAITFQNVNDPFYGEQPGQQPLTRGGICVDRGASASGGSYRIAGWWNINLAGTGYSLWSGGSPNQGSTEPYDYISSGFDTHRVYEYSIPYTGTGDELGLNKGDLVNLAVVVNDAKGGSPASIGRIPSGAGGVTAPYQSFMLNGKPKAKITDLSDTLVYSGEDISFDASGSTDPENDPMTYRWDFNYNGYTFTEGATGVTTTHTFDTDGAFTVAMIAEDSNGAGDITTISLETIEPEVSPLITNASPETDPTIEEGEKVTFSIDYDDLNLDKAEEALHVDWVVEGEVVKSEDVNKAGTSSYSIQSTYIDEFSDGEYSVGVAVNDTYDAKGKYTDGSKEATQNWTLTVTNLNRAPTIETYSPDILTGYTTDEDKPVTFTITTKDPDGDTMLVTWSVDSIPQPMAKGNTFVFLPIADYDSAGTHNIDVAVKDTGSPSLKATLTWSIIVNNVNRNPTINTANPSGKSVKIFEGESQTFKITATDPDLDDLDYTWSVNDDEVDELGPSFTFDTDYNSATGDPYKVKVQITDGQAFDTQEWTVSVNDVDRLPNIIISQPQEGDRYTISEFVVFNSGQTTDPDKDTISYKWDFGDKSSKPGSNSQHKYEYPGDYSIELDVTTTHEGVDYEFVRMINITIDAADLEVDTITTDKYDVREDEPVLVTVSVRNEGTIDAKEVSIKLYDGTILVETSSHQTIGAGDTEEFTFTWNAKKSGPHSFSATLVGDKDTLISEKVVDSDTVDVKKKEEGISLGGEGGFPYLILLIIVIAVVLIVVLVAAGGRSKKRRLEAQERARQEEEVRKAKEAQEAAAQAAIYSQPEQVYQSPAQSLPLPPPPPPPPVSASPLVSRRAKRRTHAFKDHENESEAPKPEKGPITLEMARVAAEAGVCPSCGEEVEGDWARCIGCGQKLEVPKAKPEALKAPPPPPPPQIMKAKASEGTCPGCGEEVEVDWLKCPSCSKDLKKERSLPKEAKCPSCGEEVEPEWAKCPFCSKVL